MIKVNKRRWHRLDNTANLFPVISHRRKQNVFRMTAVLKKEIQPQFLQMAVNETMQQFPAFNVRLKNGVFWAYFETNRILPQIEEEKYLPCRFIDSRSRKNPLFRVLYYQNRIHLEVFHVLTDGTGALRFLKAICYRYIQLTEAENLKPEQLETVYGLEGSFNTQDGYMKNYSKAKKKGFKDSKAFLVKGEKLPMDDFNIFNAHMSVTDLKVVCKKRDCSITEYLAARIAYGIYCDQMGKLANDKPINIFVPVNLRKIFGTDTSLNFFSNITVSVKADQAGLDFESILQKVKEQFNKKLTKEHMQEKLAFTAGGQNNLAVRFFPLVFKKILLKAIYKYSVAGSTMPFSNVGVQQVEECFAPYFDSFRFLLVPCDHEPVSCTVVSYGDTLVFTTASFLESTLLQQAILRPIAADGIKISIESNGGRDEAL